MPEIRQKLNQRVWVLIPMCEITMDRGVKRGVRISNRLNSLFTHRTDADYKTDLTTGKRDAQESLRLAQEIINDLKLAPKS